MYTNWFFDHIYYIYIKHVLFVRAWFKINDIVQPLLKELKQLPMQLDVSQSIRNASVKLLDALVDSMFQFADQPILSSQVF